MDREKKEQQEKIRASEWYACMWHEARGALIITHGIEQPTERQIAAYLLYGEKSLNRRTI